MYDMSRVTANGYFDADDNAEARHALRQKLSAQRTEDYRNGTYARAGGVVDPLPENAPQAVGVSGESRSFYWALTFLRSAVVERWCSNVIVMHFPPQVAASLASGSSSGS